MRRAFPLLLAIAAFFIAALLWIGSSRVASRTFDRGSSANTSPTGLSLAYAYLARQPVQTVKTLTTPLDTGNVPPSAIVIRVEGKHEVTVDIDDEDSEKKIKPLPAALLTPVEEEFVRNGGRLILATVHPGGSIEVRNDAGKAATKVFPIWPGFDTLSLPEPRGLSPRSLPRGMHTLFAANGEAIVAQQEIGDGDVIVVSVPEMFENENIAIGHHLELLAALVEPVERRPLAGWTAAGPAATSEQTAGGPPAVQPSSRRRYVFFDETVHGMISDDGALALLKEWRLGPMLVLLFIAAALILWRNSRRVGPAEDEERDMRSEAIDLVASLGALYGRSMSSAESIVLYRAALERSVAALSGLRGDALHRRVAELTHDLTPSADQTLPAHAFHRQLNIINDAFRTLERSARGDIDANHR